MKFGIFYELSVPRPFSRANEWLTYHNALEQRRVADCDPVGSFVNDQVHTLNFLYCHEDYRQAAALGLPMVGAFSMSNAHLYFTREAHPTRAYQTARQCGCRIAQPPSGRPPSASTRGSATGVPA
ncbi:MAG: hypothetical protein OXH86_12310, partial [Acidimicrobiaceae bacterium]|nr:hypothetical protein [Acidimicrobiaceae bacterium]